MVACPQPQTRRIIRYSVTANEKVGRSNTCTLGRDRSRRAGQTRRRSPAHAGRLDRLLAVRGGHRGQTTAAMPRLPTLLTRSPAAPGLLARGRLPARDARPAGRPDRLPAFAFAFAAGPSGSAAARSSRSPGPPAAATPPTRPATPRSTPPARPAARLLGQLHAAPRPTPPTPHTRAQGAGGSDTAGVKHDQTADTSTDTPQVSRGSDWLRGDRTRK